MRAQNLESGEIDLFGVALRGTIDELRITSALRHAKDLQSAARLTADPARDARTLETVFRDGDGLSAIASLHAIAELEDPLADRLLLDVAVGGEPAFSAHAAWALGARQPSAAAISAMHDLAITGGFGAMVAERTLLEWAPPPPRTLHRIDLRRPVHDGIVVIQPFLHARLDRLGSHVGSGDSGGIASLLRSLGAVLPDVDDVAEVISVNRRRGDEPRSERIDRRHRVERIDVGPEGPMPWRQGWLHRTQIEQQFVAIGEALAGRRVVWHLRMADVGSLAAADAARRLGHKVVFTAAPDPHIVIDALQDSGRLDRSNFAFEDAATQYWFRARLVERLAIEADHLVLLPRPTINQELIELVGVAPIDLERRSTIIAEGVDVGEVERARRRAVDHGRPEIAGRIIDSLPNERRMLPWLLTVGRLNPSKGPQRIVDAVAGDLELASRVNIVIIGGDLDHPSPDEQSTIERIRLAARGAHDGLVTLTGHLPPSEVSDLMADMVSHGGAYVCASDKEEFGLAIVEALAAGAVVVAPERGGPRTYVAHGETGILCDTLSIEALHDAILEALELEAAPGRTRRAREMVGADLSIERMAEQLGDVYRALVPRTQPDAFIDGQPAPSRASLPLG